jgi:hypothetical protein
VQRPQNRQNQIIRWDFRGPSQRGSQNVFATIADASMLIRLEQKKYSSL